MKYLENLKVAEQQMADAMADTITRPSKSTILQSLLAFDKAVNAVCGGDPQETISSRVGKREDGNERFWARVVDSIFFWDKNHSTKSVQPEEGSDAIFK